MSIVAVHGPNTMGASGAGGAGTGQTITNTGGTVTANMANGMQFTFAGAGDRAAADYDWSFTGETAQPNVKNGTITFSTGGAKVITLTLGTSGGTTPAGGTYTFNVTATATATPRSLPGGGEEPPPEEEPVVEEETVEGEAYYDPDEHTVDEVKAYVESHPDELDEIYEAEVDGKNRSSLVTWLEDQMPFDPGEYSVADVVEYAESHPDELDDILAAETAGKNRSTLVSQLEALRSA